jgi:hypothetical protein
MTPSITEDAVNTALGDLLQAMLPQLPAANIIVGQVNRVASPEGDFVVFWPLRRPRLGTNFGSDQAALFVAAIAGTSMTVSSLTKGTIIEGTTVFGAGVAANTVVGNQISGTPGGIGVYAVTPSQTVASETMLAGGTEIMQPTEVVMQLDVHGPSSADNAQVISTLFRDDFAVQQLAATGLSPFFTDDPRQTPFLVAANQYEDRWTLDAHFQIDPTVVIAQQFATALTLSLYNVDHPPPS